MDSIKQKRLYVLTLSMGSGGAEKVISLLLPYLTLKYDVTLVLFSRQSHFKVPDNIDIFYLTQNRKLSFINKIFSFPLAIYKYIKMLRANKVDISMSFLTRPNFVNGISKVFSPSTKVVLSERCYPSVAYKSSWSRYWLYKFLIPLIYNRGDLLFSNSVYINKDLIENFGLTIPDHVVYNPVEIPETFVKSEQQNNQCPSMRIVNVGSLTPIKNQKLILTALSICTIDYEMTFVGDGLLKNELKEFTGELGIDSRVNFVGRVTNVNHYLRNSDCFLLSSNSEGFPNALLEAMALGLPTISTNCLSGPLEIVNNNKDVNIKNGEFFIGEFGILVNINDAKGLAAAIEFLNAHPLVRSQLSAVSIQRASHYSIELIVEQLIKIID